ncbi:hypothetical protein ABIB82_007354 [Bradyrhizobium sp. i1.8.4]|uniref:hypothetical protein n=1 Tax=unclassified Bradyrhizobium TaxID=2631580 RepID=UPI003D1D88AB
MGTVILKDKVSALCAIAGWSRRPLSKAGRSALLWTTVAMLAMAWAPETRAFPDLARPSAEAQHAAAASDLGSIEAPESEVVPPSRGGNERSVRVVQATANDTGQASKREHNWAETLSCELTNARGDIELLQRLEQARYRAESLEQGLAAARRDVETQAALADKAVEEAARVKQAAQGSTELLNSLQEARERAERLERNLAAARRDIETQTELATRAGEETSQLKAAGAGGVADLQRERERSAQLEQDLKAARHDAETQTALAAKAGEEASRLKGTQESGAAELQSVLQGERERIAQLEQDLVAARRDIEAQTALATTTKDDALRQKRAADAGAAELKQARERADALAQELSLSRSSIYAHEAQARKAADEAAELRQAAANDTASARKLTPEDRERFARMEQDLAAARRDTETETARAAKASEEVSRLKQERESSTAELQSSLQKERERSARLEGDLAAVRRDIETKTALVTKAGEETYRLKAEEKRGAGDLQKERERSVRLEQDLAAARRDVEAKTTLVTKASEEISRLNAAEQSSAANLQKERERSARLEQDLTGAQRNVEAKTVLVPKAGEEASRLMAAGQSSAADLQKERERSARLGQDLAAVRRDVETQTARAAKASEEAVLQKQTAEASATELKQLLARADAQAQGLSLLRGAIRAYEAQGRRAGNEVAGLGQGTANGASSLRKAAEVPDRAERLGQNLASAQSAASDLATTGSTARDKPIEVAANPVTERAPATPARGVAQPSTEQAAEAAALVARASSLVRQGDVGAARLVLERAVEMGSAQASFALAETYDPLVLAKWGTYGTRGDARRARDLYARADAAGIQEAKSRLEALRR